jgi:hypothetical protein
MRLDELQARYADLQKEYEGILEDRRRAEEQKKVKQSNHRRSKLSWIAEMQLPSRFNRFGVDMSFVKPYRTRRYDMKLTLE